MAKNKKSQNNTPVAETKSVSVTPAPVNLTAEQQELANIEARAAQLKTEIANKQAAEKQARTDMINGFITAAGVADVTGLINFLKSNSKGSSARGRKIDAAVKAAIDADVKAGNGTGEAIATRHGVSGQYVQGRRKALGMVKTRKVSAV